MDLPDDLELPLRTGAAWWYWLGGRPALDLVNSFRERWWRQVETLVTPADLATWLVRAQLLTTEPLVTEELLVGARGLREAIEAGVSATLAGDPVPRGTLALLERWVPLAVLPERLELDGDGAVALVAGVPEQPARWALALVARDAAIMFGAGSRHRVRVCASEGCSARFYDHSPAGQRRWCSMRGCGNAAKARRHRARVRAATQEAQSGRGA